jgi:tellurite resistance protein
VDCACTYCEADVPSIIWHQVFQLKATVPMSQIEPNSLTPQDCLVALMVAVSASDEDIRTTELVKIQAAVQLLPIFRGYDEDRLTPVSQTVFDLFEQEDGLDALFGLIRDNLPERLFETAYALACDVAAADGTLEETELRLLEEIRYELNLDRLHAAAIERGARARHLT